MLPYLQDPVTASQEDRQLTALTEAATKFGSIQEGTAPTPI